MNGIFRCIALIDFFAAARREYGHVPAEGVQTPMEVFSAGMISSAIAAVELASCQEAV